MQAPVSAAGAALCSGPCIRAGRLQESLAAALCQMNGGSRVLLRCPPGALKPPVLSPWLRYGFLLHAEGVLIRYVALDA